MKTTLVLCTLAVFAVSNAADELKAPVSRANLDLGYVSSGDALLIREYIWVPPIRNTIQSQVMVYRGNWNTRISAIQASEVGNTQHARAWVISGGIGRNNTIVRVQSARGYGFYYQMDILGRYNS